MWETVGVHTDRVRIAIDTGAHRTPNCCPSKLPAQTEPLLTCPSPCFPASCSVLVLVLAALVIVVVGVIFVVGVHAAVGFRRPGLLLDDILLILIL